MTALINLPVTRPAGTPTRPTEHGNGDAEALAAELRKEIKGEVRFDAGSRALYATDGSNYRQVPIGVVVPRDKDDAIATMALCRKYGAPVLSRGGGTSLAGQCCNVAVVLDFSKYMRQILWLDPDRKLARVQPGTVLDFVRGAAEDFNLTYGPDPSTHNHCTFGGMIGNNSCGVHSILAGKTDANTEELEILLYDGTHMTVGKPSEEDVERIIRGGGRQGEIYATLRAFRDKYAEHIRRRFPPIPRRVSGYNLPYLLPEHGFDIAKALVGSEGTLVMVLEATIRLVYSPPSRTLVVIGYPDVYQAGDHVPEIMGYKPIGLEGLDKKLIHFMQMQQMDIADLKLLPEGGGWLVAEFGGKTREESDAKARAMIALLQKKPNAPSFRMYDNREDELKVWKVREAGLGATAHVPGHRSGGPGWEDSAVPPDKVGPYLRDLRKLFDQHDLDASLYGHFGQGCVHCRINFEMTTQAGI
jgi:FAD/FMN-containing dehydrogenase